MKRARRCSANDWAVERLSFGSRNSPRPRVRKRRFPLPRQTRGRDLDALISYRVAVLAKTEPATSSTISETRQSKSLRLVRWALWVCVIIAGLILFGDLLGRFFREAPFAWPSINGEF